MTMRSTNTRIVLTQVLFALLLFGANSRANAQGAAGPIHLDVDSTHAPQKILHVREQIPVEAGALTIVYPQWIPGEHQPTGPIINVAGMKIMAGGKLLSWRRDLINMYAIHLDVPQGVTSLDMTFDFLLSAPASGYSSGASATSFLNLLSWNQVVFFPQGNAANVQVIPSLKLPDGWKFGTALPVAKQEGNVVDFSPVSLETLIDSPVIAGRYFRVIPLSDQAPRVEMDIAADSAAALEMPPETEEHYKQLVAEATALFGSHHYRDYHFLVSLSDYVAHFGLEHHESSDDRIYEKFFTDENTRTASAYLLSHEYVHSWNGKYRRPQGLLSPDYQQPMQDDLLWVYEGLTNYWGEILAARSGLWTPQDEREYLANAAANLDNEPGRQWRPLQDTADAAVFLYNADVDWSNWRRSTDFYHEGTFLWLDVDDTIRRLTQNQKSLNDFCRLFHGGASGQPDLKPYNFDDVVAALNQTAPNDWKTFLRTRLDSIAPDTMDEALAASGWKVAYNDQPNDMEKKRDEVMSGVSLDFSVGLYLGTDGTVKDVIYDGPAYKAGIGPGMTITAVDGTALTPQNIRDVFNNAIKAAATNKEAIRVYATNGADVQAYNIDYHGGLRYAHLVRDESRPDLLTQIISPIAK